jgi:hypothetical protein
MRHIEVKHLHRLCERLEVDRAEIDSSITYVENKSHILSMGLGRDLDTLAAREVPRYEAEREARHAQGSYHKGAICPKCGKGGSGLHVKWVLNEQKRRYEPYYSFAHSIKIQGAFKVQWHYVRKARALEILGNSWITEQYQLRQHD